MHSTKLKEVIQTFETIFFFCKPNDGKVVDGNILSYDGRGWFKSREATEFEISTYSYHQTLVKQYGVVRLTEVDEEIKKLKLEKNRLNNENKS